MKKIIGFVGHIGSGKGAACEHLQKKYNTGYFRYSTMLRDLVRRIYLPENRDMLIRMSEAIRHEFGENTMSRVIAHDVVADPHEIVCVDGIRRIADIDELRKIPGFKLVFIDSRPEIRFKRISSRGENSDEHRKTFEQFSADEQRTTEKSIDDVAAEATHVITNNGTFEEFMAKIEKLIIE